MVCAASISYTFCGPGYFAPGANAIDRHFYIKGPSVARFCRASPPVPRDSNPVAEEWLPLPEPLGIRVPPDSIDLSAAGVVSLPLDLRRVPDELVETPHELVETPHELGGVPHAFVCLPEELPWRPEELPPIAEQLLTVAKQLGALPNPLRPITEEFGLVTHELLRVPREWRPCRANATA